MNLSYSYSVVPKAIIKIKEFSGERPRHYPIGPPSSQAKIEAAFSLLNICYSSSWGYLIGGKNVVVDIPNISYK